MKTARVDSAPPNSPMDKPEMSVRIRVAKHPDADQPRQFVVKCKPTDTVDEVCNRILAHPVLKGLVTIIVLSGKRWSPDVKDERLMGTLKAPVALISCSRPLDIVRASFKPSYAPIQSNYATTLPYPEPPDTATSAAGLGVEMLWAPWRNKSAI